MRTPFSGAGLVAAAALAFVACGADSRPSAAPSFSLTDSAGVQLAVTEFSEPVPQTDWVVDASSEVVYGESGGDEVQFVWIRNARRLPDGRVIAIDPRLRKLFVFSPEGDLLAQTGREGDGPGEFKDPGGVVSLGGDTILVYDASHMRFSLFDTDGNFLDDRRLERPEGGDEAPRLTLYAAVDVSGDTITLRGEGYSFRSTSSGDYVWENPTLRYTSDGTLVGEVAEPTKIWFYGTSDGPRTRLFGGGQDVMAAHGLVYVGDREGYEVRVYDPPRGLVRIERLERPRRPVTDETVQRYREELAENIDDPDARKRMLEFVENSPVADSLPWIRNVAADPQGNVWVTEYGTPGQDSAAVGVFSAEGEWLGAVHLPPNFSPLEIGDDYLLGALTDELDVQHLVSFGLERDAPPRETAGGL